MILDGKPCCGKDIALHAPVLRSRPGHAADLCVVAADRGAVLLRTDRPPTVEQQLGGGPRVDGVLGDRPRQRLAGKPGVGGETNSGTPARSR